MIIFIESCQNGSLNGKVFFKIAVLTDVIYENYTRVVKISEKMFMCQGWINTSAQINQGENIFGVSKQNPFTNLILVNPTTNLSYSVLANPGNDYCALQLVNSNLPQGYYYISGFLINV